MCALPMIARSWGVYHNVGDVEVLHTMHSASCRASSFPLKSCLETHVSCILFTCPFLGECLELGVIVSAVGQCLSLTHSHGGDRSLPRSASISPSLAGR